MKRLGVEEDDISSPTVMGKGVSKVYAVKLVTDDVSSGSFKDTTDLDVQGHYEGLRTNRR